MTRPLSSLRAPAETRSASEIPSLIHEVSTPDGDRREGLLAELIFASRDLAQENIFVSGCGKCMMGAHLGGLKHSVTCRTGRVLRIVGELIATVDTKPAGDEAATGEDDERIDACVKFCDGIPTEILADEKPLASMTRSLNDVIAVRRILPRLAELRTSQGVAR